MALILDRIIHRNLWRLGDFDALDYTEHPQFPREDSSVDSPAQAFRSRYGSGSGNGQFIIDATNKYVDFNEGGGELIATLTVGTYNGQTLATEIKTRLDAAGALTYTVSYSETTGKFTITATGTFSLLWKTGTHGSDNTDTHVGTTIGFSDAADDTGLTTYVSDYVRIHYPFEAIGKDLLVAYQYDFVAILNHNISATATTTLQGADNAAYTTNLVEDVVAHNSNNIYFFLASARTKQYVRLKVSDPTNPSGYWRIGTIFLGKYWEPNHKYGKGRMLGAEDVSILQESDSRNLYSIERPKLMTYLFNYPAINDVSKINALDLMENNGITKSFIICTDHESPNSNSLYVRNNEEIQPIESIHPDYYRWALNVKEVV